MDILNINKAVLNQSAGQFTSLHSKHTAVFMFLFQVTVLLVNLELRLQGNYGAKYAIIFGPGWARNDTD